MALTLLTLNKLADIPMSLSLPDNPIFNFAVRAPLNGQSGVTTNCSLNFDINPAGLGGAIFNQVGFANNIIIDNILRNVSVGFYNGSMVGLNPPSGSIDPNDWFVFQLSVPEIGGELNVGPVNVDTLSSSFITGEGLSLALSTKYSFPAVGSFYSGNVGSNDCNFLTVNIDGFIDNFIAFEFEVGEDIDDFLTLNQVYVGGLYRLLYTSTSIDNLVLVYYENFGAPVKWNIRFDDPTLNVLLDSRDLEVVSASRSGFIVRFDTGTEYRYILIDPRGLGYSEYIVTYADSAVEDFVYVGGANSALHLAVDDDMNIYGFGSDFVNDVTFGLNSSFPTSFNIEDDFIPNPQPIKLPCLPGVYPCIPFIQEN